MGNITERFLTNTDETGRFIVKSLVTGKTYYVEPIGNGSPADWGCTTWSTPRKDVEEQIEELNKLCKEAWEAEEKYGRDSIQSKIYGDKWADATMDMKKLGIFCADAGMVAVFLLDEVLKYNPDFNKWMEKHDQCVTLIKGFDGEINYHIDNDGDAHIIGKGNINFYTTQTGL